MTWSCLNRVTWPELLSCDPVEPMRWPLFCATSNGTPDASGVLRIGRFLVEVFVARTVQPQSVKQSIETPCLSLNFYEFTIWPDIIPFYR